MCSQMKPDGLPTSTTLKMLEGMTDEGAFERLAIAVLRRMESDCEAVVHEGINAEGKPIPAPLDGFGLIPGTDPPRFIMIACTTTSRDGLRSKWLLDHTRIPTKSAARTKRKKTLTPADDGDSLKAARAAAQQRQQFPNATFKVYLVTNRIGVAHLIADIQSTATAAGMDAEIVDATRIADFLDFDPRGEWVRSHFFGTAIRHISEDLLRETSHSSIMARRTREDFATVGHLVSRDSQESLRQLLTFQSVGLVWLVAPPGKGKSVLSVQAADAYFGEGGLALWVSEHDASGAENLTDAVESALRREQPALAPGAGLAALKVSDPARRLMLLLDDLNRVESPVNAFRKLRNWIARAANPSGDTKENSGRLMPYIVICPIWPEHLEGVRRTLTAGRLPAWERVVDVSDLSDREFSALFAETGLTREEQQTILRELGRDPLLCAVYGNELRTNPTTRLRPAGVVERYVERELDGVAGARGHPISEYHDAVAKLAEVMLCQKQLRPTWAAVRRWFSGDAHLLDRLTELIAARKIIYVAADSDAVLFTHDRLLNIFAASRIPALLKDDDTIGEPYFAEIIGRAIVSGLLDEASIRSIAYRNPLSTFVALQFAEDPELQYRLGSIVKQWLQTRSVADCTPDGLWWEITRVLVKTDAPTVIEIAGMLPSNWNLFLAALRNGSATGGVDYCAVVGKGWFLPGLRDQHRDGIIEHAVAHHRRELVAELDGFLSVERLAVADRYAALVLAGFLGLEELRDGVHECCRNSDTRDRVEIIAPTLWALARCRDDAQSDTWREVLDKWELMPPPAEEVIDSIAYDELGHCPATWLPNHVVEQIITLLPSYPRIRQSLEHLISRCDCPAAFNFEVRRLGAEMRKNENSSYLWVYLTFSRWDRRNLGQDTISEPSRWHLYGIWSNKEEPVSDRQAAFALWLLSATAADLPILRLIGSGSALFDAALVKRMELHDRTTLQFVEERLTENSSLLHHLPAVWSSSMRTPVLQLFRNHGAKIFYAGRATPFFLSIPLSDAESLIEEIWPLFPDERDLAAAALLIGTSAVRALADRLLLLPGKCDRILQHVRFVMMTREPYLNNEELLPSWLERCTSYLHLATQETLRGFMMICRSPEAWSWYEENVVPLLRAESERDVDKRMDLGNLENQWRQMPDPIYGAQTPSS
ncbi:MAG: hypothetical protein QOD12_2313 [Verrucomicrobiota bacterium]